MPNEAPSPIRILVIEDEAVIALDIQEALLQIGYRVVGVASNGDKALDLLASTKPDLVLLDINIEGTRSGIDLARIIRRKYNFPFVFLTALADRATLDRLRDTLPYGYIIKPFNESDLYTTIELALDKFAAERRPAIPSLKAINERLSTPLTGREYQLLELLERGMSYQELADELFISVNTVKYHLRMLYGKFGVSSRGQIHHALANFAYV